MSARELQEWIAFSNVEPIGDDREDVRMAMICTTIINAAGAKKENGDPFSLTDFVVDFWKQDEPEVPKVESWKRNKEIMAMVGAALGGGVPSQP